MPRRDKLPARPLPLLGYALLGLIHQKPCSGYDLRKTFAETAMGNYSSSPGAIYPALQRLENDGLVVGSVEETAGLRRKRVCRITKSGASALKNWLVRPIQPTEIRRGIDELMLRFAFMEGVLGPRACIDFLRSFGDVLTSYVSELEAFHATQSGAMPLSARLAFESGLRTYRCIFDWTQYALQSFEDLETRGAVSTNNLKGDRS